MDSIEIVGEHGMEMAFEFMMAVLEWIFIIKAMN